MSNPFQDQLLKAGLVNKKQVKKAKHEKRVDRKKNKGTSPPVTNNKAQQEHAAQAKRNKELNKQRAKETQQREKVAQVKQLIKDNRLKKDDRGEAYNFVDQNKIKRIYIAAEMAEQLSRGLLAIVMLAGSYEVVPAKVAKQIASRDAEAVVTLHTGS